MTAQARLLGDRYQVGELLGYGGMAEVHRGRDLRLGRDVAIKLLRTDLARDQTFQERFRREAQNAAALNHPAIVAVYDTGEETGPTGERLPFIVMEFVNGRTLKEVLAAEGRIMPRRALEITADMCAALEFSHRHGIIHRDIKPGNVMLTQNGQVKVMDFGIARALASGATTMTQTSAVIGTAQYLSPEQARGEAVDARSDVYAAGCVLFELLCGHPPFVGDSPVSVAYQHVREDPPTPSDINRDVPPDLDAIVLKALAKNPLNRYQSAQEMRADVLRAVSGRPVLATPVLHDDETMAIAPTMRPTGATRPVPATVGGPPPPQRTSSWVMAAIAGLGVLAVVALVVGLILMGKRANTPEASKATVPPLAGMTVDQATTALRGVGLSLDTGTPVQDDKCTEGQIVNQEPDANAAVDRGSAVVVNVCAGPGKIKVPDLKGFTKEGAATRLAQDGLKPNFQQVDNAATKDQVVEVPDAGNLVEKGDTVEVRISRGNVREMPNVIDRPVAEAEAQLRNLGFNNIRKVPGDEVDADEAGRVERQDPPARTPTKVTDRITLTVTVPADPGVDDSPSPTPSVTGSPTPGGLLPG